MPRQLLELMFPPSTRMPQSCFEPVLIVDIVVKRRYPKHGRTFEGVTPYSGGDDDLPPVWHLCSVAGPVAGPAGHHTVCTYRSSWIHIDQATGEGERIVVMACESVSTPPLPSAPQCAWEWCIITVTCEM